MAHIFLYWAFLPLLASAFSWHSWSYEMGFFGAHPTLKHVSFDQQAPEVNMLQWDPRCEDSYVLLSPRGRFYPEPGPLIYDNRGNLVWIDNQLGMVMDLNVQHYKGQNYLTFFTGDDDGTRGIGSYYMLNSSYEVAHVVSAANGYSGDVHDFKITDQGTALMTIYEICPMDLSAVGGPEDGWVYDGIFQEIDIETGELLFEWRARDHYAVEETYFERSEEKGTGPTAGKAFDYFHINSIAKYAHGNYLVSSRYMHTVTCISPTGDILWILGGKRNMFKDLSEDGSATGFTWQHDARWLSENVITLLDNGAHEHLQTADYSRAYMIELDFENWTATTLHTYESPGHFSSHSQGNVQVLPRTGNVFIGWGKPSAYTEFSADGEVLCDAHWGPSMFFWFGWVKSYRAQKAMWVGRPSSPPDVVMDGRTRTVYVSWNGATDVIGWVMQRASRSDASDGDFELVGYTAKEGFETSIVVPDEAEGHYLRMVAVDQEGETLGVTRVFSTSDETPHVMASGPSQENLQHTLLAACALGVLLAAFWKGKRRILSLGTRCRRSVYDRV